MKEIVATVTVFRQTGPDTYISHSDSRIFSIDRPISDLLSFAETVGIKNPSINDVLLSNYTGKSM